ncbi:MAG: hypothetical protein D6706_09105 [Chloroflexi bacterium]|nr:MAG: hypothetical protein D6706_09105 [Chloroflexota bacterium]
MENTAYAVTSSGNTYMTKAGGILEKYDPQGVLLWTGSFPANTRWPEIMVDPAEKSVKVFSYIDDYSGYYISSFDADGTAQWRITGPDANFSSTRICLDYEGNLYLSNTPNKTIARINNKTGLYDWTYSADTSRILGMKALPSGDLIVLRANYVQRLTQTAALTLLDAGGRNLSNNECFLIRVSGDAANRTEDTLGIVNTDSNGEIQLTPVP